LWVANDLNAKDIGQAGSHILTELSQNEQFALLVEEHHPGQHREEFEPERPDRQCSKVGMSRM
jgi:hypothetical protein